MNEVWVIYDSANESYLTGGNWSALEYGRVKNPLDNTHRYPREDIAIKMLKRLRGEIVKANAQTEWHMLPIWNPKEQARRRKQDNEDCSEYPVKVQPILCIRRIHSPQIEEVDL